MQGNNLWYKSETISRTGLKFQPLLGPRSVWPWLFGGGLFCELGSVCKVEMGPIYKFVVALNLPKPLVTE